MLLTEAKNSLAGFPKNLIQKIINNGGGSGSSLETVPMGKNKISAAVKQDNAVGVLGYYEKSKPGYLIIFDEAQHYQLYVTKELVKIMGDNISKGDAVYDKKDSKPTLSTSGEIRTKEHKYYTNRYKQSGYFWKAKCSLQELLELVPQGEGLTNFLITRDKEASDKRKERRNNQPAKNDKNRLSGYSVAKSLIKMLMDKVSDPELKKIIQGIDVTKVKNGYEINSLINGAVNKNLEELKSKYESYKQSVEPIKDIAHDFYNIDPRSSAKYNMDAYKKIKSKIDKL